MDQPIQQTPIISHKDIESYKLGLKIIIDNFFQDNPNYNLRILGQLLIGNSAIASYPIDANLQQIKSSLEENLEGKEPLKSITKGLMFECILEYIYDKTKINEDKKFSFLYSERQILAWVYSEKISDKTSLAIRNCSLPDEWSPGEWGALFAGIKYTGFKSLDLGLNNLDRLDSEEWTMLFAGIKYAGIKSLRLDLNNLRLLSDSQWAAFCDGLASSDIIDLDVSKNKLNSDRIEQLKSIIMQNKRKAGLSENGLQKLCYFTLWAQPGISLGNLTNIRPDLVEPFIANKSELTSR